MSTETGVGEKIGTGVAVAVDWIVGVSVPTGVAVAVAVFVGMAVASAGMVTVLRVKRSVISAGSLLQAVRIAGKQSRLSRRKKVRNGILIIAPTQLR